MITCTKKDCTNPAWATPCVRVWKMEMPFKQNIDKAANFHFADCPTCIACAADMKLDTFMNEAAQKMVETSFAKQGKPIPAWKTATLEWIPLAARVAESAS